MRVTFAFVCLFAAVSCLPPVPPPIPIPNYRPTSNNNIYNNRGIYGHPTIVRTQYQPPPKANNHYQPPTRAINQYQPPPKTINQYQPPPKAINQYQPPPKTINQYQPPPKTINQYQPPPKTINQYQPPPKAINQYQPPPKTINQYQPPPKAINQYQPPPKTINQYQPPPKAVNQYQPPPKTINQYQPPSRTYQPLSSITNHYITPRTRSVPVVNRNKAPPPAAPNSWLNTRTPAAGPDGYPAGPANCRYCAMRPPEPRCGINNVTYINDCFMDCEYMRQDCDGPCPCSYQHPPNSGCWCRREDHEPVCAVGAGAHMKTLASQCEAVCERSRVAYDGPCWARG